MLRRQRLRSFAARTDHCAVLDAEAITHVDASGLETLTDLVMDLHGETITLAIAPNLEPGCRATSPLQACWT